MRDWKVLSMKKPWYYMPFIAVYKTVFLLLRLPFYCCKYFCLGFYEVSKRFYGYIVIGIKGIGNGVYIGGKLFISFFLYICQYLGLGLVLLLKILGHAGEAFISALSYMVYYIYICICKAVRWIGKLFYTWGKYLLNGILSIWYAIRKVTGILGLYINIGFLACLAFIRSLLHDIQLKLEWYAFNQKRNKEYAKKVKERKQKEKELKAREKAILDKQRALFAKTIRDAKRLEKEQKKKKAKEMRAMVIDFASEDAVKSEKKLLYEYVAKNPEGKVVKDYLEAFSKVEVHSFLMSEGYEVYSIKTSPWITFLHGQTSTNKTKVKTKDLIFFITQLSTYIKAGIPLAEALKILTRQYKKASYKKIFSAVMYDLTMGVAFSEALQKQGNAFPKLLINMIKTAEMTGELPEALDDMADYYTEVEKTRKQMITALMYPTMVFIFAIAVIVFILIWVIPQFVAIYESMDASKIPGFTLFVMGVSAFLKNYFLWLLLGIIVFIIVFIILYKKVQSFRKNVQKFVMHMPVFGNVVIYNEVTMFTKTFASLLKHNVFITDSMEILTKITDNEIYRLLIFHTIDNIAHGEKISKSFENHWAFPIPAYEMLVTGEKTGQLPDMMAKVSSYYQEQHAQQVARIKTFIEPVLIIFLTVMVGMIILAIIIPMFGMYDLIE